MGRLSLAAIVLLSISTVANAGVVSHILDTGGSGGSTGIGILTTDFAGSLGSGIDPGISGGPLSGGLGTDAFLVSEFGLGGPSSGKGGSGWGGWSGWGGYGCGGDCHVTPVPEPRYIAVMLVGLLLIGSATLRKIQALRRARAYVTVPQAQ